MGSNPTPSAILIRTKQWWFKGSSSLCEKLRENVAAFGGENTARYFCLVVEARVIKQVVQRFDGARLWIVSPENDMAYARIKGSACAHRAWF